MKARTLFLSDLHLGSPYTSSRRLRCFLEALEPPIERIYLVGDLFDFWQLGRRWTWSKDASSCLQQLLRLAADGTKLYWAVGNHDELVQDFAVSLNLVLAGYVAVGREFVHVLERQPRRKLLVHHGHCLDPVKHAEFAFGLGDRSWRWLAAVTSRRVALMLSEQINAWTHRKFKFEESLIAHAREQECDGVICGHSHIPKLEQLPDGFLYGNTGDWLESCTAIYEDWDGVLHLHRQETGKA